MTRSLLYHMGLSDRYMFLLTEDGAVIGQNHHASSYSLQATSQENAPMYHFQCSWITRGGPRHYLSILQTFTSYTFFLLWWNDLIGISLFKMHTAIPRYHKAHVHAHMQKGTGVRGRKMKWHNLIHPKLKKTKSVLPSLPSFVHYDNVRYTETLRSDLNIISWFCTTTFKFTLWKVYTHVYTYSIYEIM